MSDNFLEIQRREIQRSIKFFDSIKLKYAIELDDEIIANGLDVKVRTRTPSGLPRGTLTNYVRQHVDIDNAPVWSVARIPVGDFDPNRLRNTVAAIAHNSWGVGTYVTNLAEDEHIELMRTA